MSLLKSPGGDETLRACVHACVCAKHIVLLDDGWGSPWAHSLGRPHLHHAVALALGPPAHSVLPLILDLAGRMDACARANWQRETERRIEHFATTTEN